MEQMLSKNKVLLLIVEWSIKNTGIDNFAIYARNYCEV